MKSFILKDYIESKTTKSKEKYTLELKYSKLKTFFESITSILLEDDLAIILLDHHSKIISIYSNEGNYPHLYNGEFNINTSSTEKDLQIFVSPLFNNDIENIKYRFVLISLDDKKEKLMGFVDNLNKGLTKLFNHNHKEFNAYYTLLDSLDAVDDGISACDANGIVTYINESGCNIIGGKKEEIIGQNLKSLTSSNAILNRVIKTKKTYQDLEYFLDFKSKNIHLMTSAYPILDRNNNIIGAIDIFRRIKRSIKVATDLVGYGAVYKFENFIGKSKALYEAIELAKKFAHSNKNILITGESGTGKELFAQAIHNYSTRRNNPFVAINCASYPKDLFDSELFGYEEGAFTGAKKGGKAGKFELASGGTLFLDEIGEMPLHLQAKLLRVIETKSITRIGSNKKFNVDVRIIAATNRNLEEMVKNNSFREDLYYRLKVLYLHLEPLRNREEDSILLSNYFINKFSQDSDKNIIGLDKDAAELIKSHKWPGNIRELENLISLSLFYCNSNYVTRDNLINAGLKNIKDSKTNNTYTPSKLSEVTKEIIIKTLEKNNGNKKRTAEELGISRSTIYRLLS